MSAPRKFSDADLRKAWEDIGNIRETARRLKFSYNAVYARLVQLNLIRAPTFDPGREHTARTIPDGTTLIIPDLQAPAHHPDALAFLMAIRDRVKPINTVCIGDELDLNWLSDFAKLPEVDQPLAHFDPFRHPVRWHMPPHSSLEIPVPIPRFGGLPQPTFIRFGYRHLIPKAFLDRFRQDRHFDPLGSLNLQSTSYFLPNAKKNINISIG